MKETKHAAIEPTETEYESYATHTNLPKKVVKELYSIGEKPILAQKWIAFLFNPLNILLVFFFGIGLGIVLLWFYFDPFLTQLNTELAELTIWFAERFSSNSLTLSEEGVSTSTTVFTWFASITALVFGRLKVGDLFSKLVSWLWQLISKTAMKIGKFEVFDTHNYLFNASKEVRKIFIDNKDSLKDPAPKFYIFGHDHHPESRVIPLLQDEWDELDAWDEWDDPVYLNTGAWLPDFDGETRRLRTGGKDVEFTFLKIWKKGNKYVHELLQWNDNGLRADSQIVPTDKKKDAPTNIVKTVLGGVLLGAFVGVWLEKLIISLLVFGVVGYLIGYFLDRAEANRFE
ncbi:MAG: hypothetical protein GY805_19530 [Chloroflexi bacterium]|nr:hypothetical protein [Chloroflexota bacterium]